MSLIADGLLIATCLTAAIYCFVLGRRLKQFSSTEEGVGKQIMQLSATLDETRIALKEAQSGAKAAAEELARNLTEARKLSHRLQDLISSAAGTPEAPGPKTTRSAKSVTFDDDVSSPLEKETFAAAAAIEPMEASTVKEEVDLAEINMDDLLSNTKGEQQLGFLPDDGEEDGDDSALSAAPGADAVPGEAQTGQDAIEEAGNLLKVERMAL